jgi:hypothetical protein
MKIFFIPALLFCLTTGHCQFTTGNSNLDPQPVIFNHLLKSRSVDLKTITGKIKIDKTDRWKLDGNKLFTGGLLMLSGSAKGLNETLEFNWHGFAAVFPRANPQWFWPQQSYKNKYKGGDRANGEKFPLSSSVLVMFTDQYHLDNFIHRGALTAALVIKIGEGKKPFRHYLFDALYYTACYQLGFGTVYYYFKSRVPE